MHIKKGEILFNTTKLLNIVLIVFSIYECFVRYYNLILPEYFYWKGQLLIVAVFTFLYMMFSDIYDAFDIKTGRISEILYGQVLSLLVSDTIMYLIIVFIMKGFPNILPALATLIAQVVFCGLWSFASKKLYMAAVPALATAIICDTSTDLKSIFSSHQLDSRFDIKEIINTADCIDNVDCLNQFETVFLKIENNESKSQIIKHCVENGINAFFIPSVGDLFIYGSEQRHMLHLPVMMAGRYNPPFIFLFVKRLFDILVSAISIIILSPALIGTAIAVKKCDNGPVFYKQTRLTKDGRLFKIIKFRSMRVDAEKNGAQLSSGDNDDRVTPVGKVIRKIRLDELPQLFNILKGDMSFVGPRPERPEIAEQYCQELPEFSLRLQAKAGLTGYAQIYGKYNTTPEDKLKMDLMYISNPTIAEDFKLIFATIKILFAPESTEGFESPEK